MSTDAPASEHYQRSADMLRKAMAEQLRANDPARDLLRCAANQLENAADTAQMLERILNSPEWKTDMIKDRPSNRSGQWESERQVDISRARAEGFAIGLALAGVISFGAVGLRVLFG